MNTTVRTPRRETGILDALCQQSKLSTLNLVASAHRQESSLLISSSPLNPPCMCRLKRVKILEGKKRKKELAGESCLTSACPPPSFAASCPAGPLSRRAPPRHPSGPTGPASGPSFLASARRAAAPEGEDEERHGHRCSGGRGWDNPGGTQRGVDELKTEH